MTVDNLTEDPGDNDDDLPDLDDAPDYPGPDDIITCWCGATGTYDDLFDDSGLDGPPCGGLGILNCECGGDICVCHHHGECECPGCEECEGEDENWEHDCHGQECANDDEPEVLLVNGPVFGDAAHESLF